MGSITSRSVLDGPADGSGRWVLTMQSSTTATEPSSASWCSRIAPVSCWHCCERPTPASSETTGTSDDSSRPHQRRTRPHPRQPFRADLNHLEDDAKRERCNALAVKLGGDATQIFFE